MEDEPVYIDIERMNRALAGPRWRIPQGLTPEEIRQHITDAANGLVPPDSENKEE